MAHSLRILFIDDQPAVRDAFSTLMSALGHRVLVASTPDAALEELERSTIDVLITDHELDDLVTGPLLIQEARRRGFPAEAETVLLAANELVSVPAGVRLLRKTTGVAALLEHLEALSRRPTLVSGGPLPVLQRNTDPFLTALPRVG